MKILGIESSCDETSLALLEVKQSRFKLLKHVIASQVDIHKKYGGVVPEVAARRHLEVMQPLLDKEIGKKTLKEVDIIAVTAGPGLVTSLMVGVQAAKTLSYVLEKPLLGINHMEAHIYANWLSDKRLTLATKKHFPALVLIVSGGHTQIVLMKDHGKYQLLGQTLDDAAGESFDKVAKVLDLGYPGGPIVSKLADQGNPEAIEFPRPLMHADNYDVSFSGLKTAVLYYLENKQKISKKQIPDIAASFQAAVIDLLMTKFKKAQEEYGAKSFMLAGGVSANKSLRQAFEQNGKEVKRPVFIPAVEFTGDNAAMIAATAYFRRKQAKIDNWKKLTFDARLKFI